MKVIDRYVLREFLYNILYSLLFFTVLILVVRFSEKELGRFVSSQMSISASMFSLVLKLPGYIIQVAPASVLFATFFSLGRMSQNNEITAMRAAGISLYRVFLPVFIAAFMIALLMIIFNDQVVTRANSKDAELDERYSGTSQLSTHLVFESSGNRVFYIYLIFRREHRMQNVTIQDFDENNEVRQEIFAKYASWSGQTWYLKDGIVRIFSKGSNEEKAFNDMEITVPEDPEIMVKGTSDLDKMSFNELLKLVKYKKAAGRTVRKDLVTLHDRISFPFACFMMALLGAPLFIIFGRSGTAVGFLLTMFISFLYWGIALAVFEAFGNNGKLPPMLSCWVGNFLFAAVGLCFVYKVKK